MKKVIFVALSLLVLVIFLVGCTEKEISNEDKEELDQKLSDLSDEELDKVIEEGESKETKALAGQAYRGRDFRQPAEVVVNRALHEKIKRMTQEVTAPTALSDKPVYEGTKSGNEYCLDYYEYVPNPGEKACFGFKEGKKGYVCKANPFPKEKIQSACPKGTNGSFYDEVTYDCESKTPITFSGCISGYNLISTKNPGTWFRCEKDGSKDQGNPLAYGTYYSPICGSSGAKAMGKAMIDNPGMNEKGEPYFQGKGYCCIYDN